jgi:hypothetical protein
MQIERNISRVALIWGKTGTASNASLWPARMAGRSESHTMSHRRVRNAIDLTLTTPLNPEVRNSLLVDLFHRADSLQHGEDKRRFRVRHHEVIEAIDAMVNSGDIREYQERYSPSLIALTSLPEPAVQSFLHDCDAVYAALRARYLENYSDLVGVDDLAEKAGIEADRFRRTLAVLNDNISVIAGSQGDYGDSHYKITPSERVLTLRTFEQALDELRAFQVAFGKWDYLSKPAAKQASKSPVANSTASPTRQWLDDLPGALGSLMMEIYSAQEAGLRALPAMGVRAAIDMACNDLVGDIGGFDAKLKELSKLGHVSDLQRETLSAVIHLGHASAHRGHTPDVADLHSIVDILERLLKSLYLDSETAQRLKSNTPSRGS